MVSVSARTFHVVKFDGQVAPGCDALWTLVDSGANRGLRTWFVYLGPKGLEVFVDHRWPHHRGRKLPPLRFNGQTLDNDSWYRRQVLNGTLAGALVVAVFGHHSSYQQLQPKEST